MLLQSYEITTPATERAVTLAGVKTFCRITSNREDDLLYDFIDSAVERLERVFNRQLITATYDMFLDDFPCNSEEIEFPRAPAQSLTHVKYLDQDGTEQTWASTEYHFDAKSTPARLTSTIDNIYPLTRLGGLRNVTFRVVCGYGSTYTSVPRAARIPIYFLCNHWWRNRDAFVPGEALSKELEYTICGMGHLLKWRMV